MSTKEMKNNIVKICMVLMLLVVTLAITTVTCFAFERDVPVTSEAINAWLESGCLDENGIPFTSGAINAWMENGCSSSEPVGKAITNFIEPKSNSIPIVEESRLDIIEENQIPVTSEAINAWMESGCLDENGIPFTSGAIDAWMENGCSSSEPVGKAITNFIETKSNSIPIVEESRLDIIEENQLPVTSGGTSIQIVE